jgi:hypothetical protein
MLFGSRAQEHLELIRHRLAVVRAARLAQAGAHRVSVGVAVGGGRSTSRVVEMALKAGVPLPVSPRRQTRLRTASSF